jgi:hypothetical protein
VVALSLAALLAASAVSRQLSVFGFGAWSLIRSLSESISCVPWRSLNLSGGLLKADRQSAKNAKNLEDPFSDFALIVPSSYGAENSTGELAGSKSPATGSLHSSTRSL